MVSEIVFSWAPTPLYPFINCSFIHHHAVLGPFIKCKYSDFFCMHSVSEESPLAHIIIYHCPQCYEYLMICLKLLKILVSVLGLVPKSLPVPLTIARRRLAIVNSTRDLETTSKGLAKLSNIAGRVVQHFIRKISNIAGQVAERYPTLLNVLSNIFWKCAVYRKTQNTISLILRRKAAVAILILDLFSDDKGSERGKTR